MKKRYLWPLIASLITLLTMILFSNYPSLVESLYSRGIYPFIAGFLSSFSALFPFSLSDLFYASLLLYVLIGLLFVLFRKLRFKTYLGSLIRITLYLFTAFYWLWGFNYYRQDISERLALSKLNQLDEKEKEALFSDLFRHLTEEAKQNYLPQHFEANTDSIEQAIEKAYQANAQQLKIAYPCGKRRAKSIILSTFYAKSGILGYYGPFFSEPHINTYLSAWDKPMTRAHEKAHQMGIAKEGEANFYAWLACSQSSYRWNRYSAALYALSMFIHRAADVPQFQSVIDEIPSYIKQDIRDRSKHWQELRNPKMNKISNQINDAYLKSNRVKKGMNDYGQMVNILMAYFEGQKYISKVQ